MSNPIDQTIFSDRDKRMGFFHRISAASSPALTFGRSKPESYANRVLRQQHVLVQADQAFYNAVRVAVQVERRACLEIAAKYSADAAAEIIARPQVEEWRPG